MFINYKFINKIIKIIISFIKEIQPIILFATNKTIKMIVSFIKKMQPYYLRIVNNLLDGIIDGNRNQVMIQDFTLNRGI